MSRPLSFVLIAGALLLGNRPASADPIRVSGGQADIGAFTGTLMLEGTRDFALSAGVSVHDGVFQPWLQCQLALACAPGAVLDFGAFWVGSSLRSAAVTVDGETYTNVGSAASTSGASVRFIASGAAPAFSGDTATVAAPFVFQGEFRYLNASLQQVVETLSGAGIVTVSLRRNPALPVWSYAGASYQFQPVPEPATVLLTAAGIAGLASRRLRRHRKP